MGLNFLMIGVKNALRDLQIDAADCRVVLHFRNSEDRLRALANLAVAEAVDRSYRPGLADDKALSISDELFE